MTRSLKRRFITRNRRLLLPGGSERPAVCEAVRMSVVCRAGVTLTCRFWHFAEPIPSHAAQAPQEGRRRR